MSGTETGTNPEAESEKIEPGPQISPSGPPEPNRGTKSQRERFARAKRPPSSSLALLRKFNLARSPRWKGKRKWSRKGKEPQNPDDQQEDESAREEREQGDEEEEDESHEGSVMIPRKSRSGPNGNIASRIDHGGDGDGEASDEDSPRTRTASKKDRRFLPTLDGCLPFRVHDIGIHHIYIFICTVTIIMLSLLIASCSSHGMRSIYLLEMSYYKDSLELGESAASNQLFYSVVANLSSTGDLAVRVGYFGVCVAINTGSESRSWICGRNTRDLLPLVEEVQDPLNLLAIADNFKDQVIVSVIIIMAIGMICLTLYFMSTFPSWHEEVDLQGEEIEVKPFPSKTVTHFVLAFMLLAVLFLITAILWQHVAVVAHAASTETAFQGAVRGKVGSVAMGLGWGSIATSVMVAAGVLYMIVNLRLLRQLTEDDN